MNFYQWAQTILANFGEVVGLRISVYRQSDRTRTLDVDNNGNARFGNSTAGKIGGNPSVSGTILTVVQNSGAARIWARGQGQGELGMEDTEAPVGLGLSRWHHIGATIRLERVNNSFTAITSTPVYIDAANKIGILTTSLVGQVHVFPNAASIVPIVAQARSNQTAALFQVQNINNSSSWEVDANQVMRIGVTSLPSTTLLNNNQAALWWDQAGGYLAILAKNSAGALMVGRVTMS